MSVDLPLAARLSVGLSRIVGIVVLSAATLVLTGISACAADEPVGHTKTTTKRTTDTPTEKTTVTETHEKDTKLYPQ
jgi:hypothetical protein